LIPYAEILRREATDDIDAFVVAQAMEICRIQVVSIVNAGTRWVVFGRWQTDDQYDGVPYSRGVANALDDTIEDLRKKMKSSS
jgi:hypothetical protein